MYVCCMYVKEDTYWQRTWPLQTLMQLTAKSSSVVLVAQETRDQVDRKRENDGRVLLRRNGVECLQVTELEGRRRLGNDLRGLFESSRGFLFALCSNNLCSGLTRSLGFGCHG